MKQITDKLLKMPVTVLLQQIPVQFSLLTPLSQLSEFLSHKQKFLTRMAEHKRIAGFQILEFFLRLSRHLIDHRAFQMHDLIMGEHENVILGERIRHGESHLVVIIFSEIRIQLHVIQEVMHPSHIPFHGET